MSFFKTIELCKNDCQYLLLYEKEFLGFCLLYNVQLNSTGFDARRCKDCKENRKVDFDV